VIGSYYFGGTVPPKPYQKLIYDDLHLSGSDITGSLMDRDISFSQMCTV